MSNLKLRTTTSATDPGSTSAKGSALTHAEMDSNLILLNNQKLENLSEDTTPSLGANLDLANFKITNSLGKIVIEPNSGNVELAQPLDLQNGQISATTDSSANEPIIITPAGTGAVKLEGPVQVKDTITGYTTDGNVTITANGTGTIVLGSDFDVNGNIIVSDSNGDIDVEPNGSGNINLTTDTGGINLSTLKSYDELLKTDNSTTGTISLDHEAAPLHYIVQTGALTISGLTTPTSGANVTLILNNSGGSYTITFDETNSTFYAVDGVDPTLTGFDMFNILCLDDTTDAEVYIVTGVGSISAIT